MEALKQILWVALGGSLGAVARYLLAGWVQRALPAGALPLGTALVNISGCLGIGLLAGIAEDRSLLRPELRAFAMVGILGGFTTFSTFAHETLSLTRDGQWAAALANVAFQVALGLLACALGYGIGRGAA